MKIVSLVPSQTELIHDLGLNKELVGVTKFCLHPSHLSKQKTIVGGTKNVDVKKVEALNPSIICANKEENTKACIEELNQKHQVHLADFNDIEGALELILSYGDLFNKKSKAQELYEEIHQLIAQVQKKLFELPRLKVSYLIWKDPLMVAASNTFIDSMLQLFKLENVFSELKRYPVIESNELTKSDIVLFSSEPFPFTEKHINSIQLNNTPYEIVNGEYFSWYGSRMKKAIPALLEWRLKLHHQLKNL